MYDATTRQPAVPGAKGITEHRTFGYFFPGHTQEYWDDLVTYHPGILFKMLIAAPSQEILIHCASARPGVSILSSFRSFSDVDDAEITL